MKGKIIILIFLIVLVILVFQIKSEAGVIYLNDGRAISKAKNIKLIKDRVYFNQNGIAYNISKNLVKEIDWINDEPKRSPAQKEAVKEKIGISKKKMTKIKANGIILKRIFKSSAEYIRVIIETNKKRMVRCAVYDNNGDIITVGKAIIEPPLDEFVIRTGNKTDYVHSAKCW